jgi:hypothetical protein
LQTQEQIRARKSSVSRNDSRCWSISSLIGGRTKRWCAAYNAPNCVALAWKTSTGGPRAAWTRIWCAV